MRCEIPVLRRCCFCFPLRIGLLVAGYFKLILSLLTLLYITSNLFILITYGMSDLAEYVIFIIIWTLSMLNSALDVVFHLIFIIGAHKKNHRMIRMYYRYSIYNIIAVTGFFILYMAVFVDIVLGFFLIRFMIFAFVLFILTIFVQLYLMVLVRSEVLKLKNSTQFQFVNNEAEARCSASIQLSDDVDGTDNDNAKTLV